ncbi:Antagonist of EGFR signaling Argos [Trinorchestia longiramus]|nr:Antagonist of EGFR signaling Argos [Trinorchestia longiramus]
MRDCDEYNSGLYHTASSTAKGQSNPNFFPTHSEENTTSLDHSTPPVASNLVVLYMSTARGSHAAEKVRSCCAGNPHTDAGCVRGRGLQDQGVATWKEDGLKRPMHYQELYVLKLCTFQRTTEGQVLGLLYARDTKGENRSIMSIYIQKLNLQQTRATNIGYAEQHSEEDLPVCSGHSVCNKISTYSTPYAERMCRCPGATKCSTSLDANDGYTVVDKNLQFKMCEPAKKLPQCKLFGEVAYTRIFYPDNVTQTIVHCTCPKNAVTYVVHKDPYRSSKGYGYFYSFACSPLQLVCKRKEPCRLFSARKRSDFEEVTTTVLCRCPSNRSCPVHHTDHGVVPGKLYSDEALRTYSGYCV